MDRKETENQDRSGSPDEAFETAETMVGGENAASSAEEKPAPAETGTGSVFRRNLCREQRDY